MRNLACILLFSLCLSSFAQERSFAEIKTKTYAVRDTIRIDSVSINPALFRVTNQEGNLIDSTAYTIDFGTSLLIFKKNGNLPDSIRVHYRAYPEFLTRRYFEYDPDLVVQSSGNLEKVYALKKENSKQEIVPFDGLDVTGSLVRGVTSGNNQNSTLNSELDLQISGKLSERVSLRASLQDANIPQQDGGYSQRLDEFDKIFIELYSDDWSIRAGDIYLENNTSY
ncbi:MAG: hypothetical protein NWQ06_09505, partial [Leeuwenhoekiella sp.]|nr:hypothetical protein [Leeuwenhoekiella sp.]